MHGVIKVKKDQQGFGFITPADGNKDLFFHFSGCVDKVDGFNSLSEGTEVSFEVQDGQKGPMAVNLSEVGMGSGSPSSNIADQTSRKHIRGAEFPPEFMELSDNKLGDEIETYDEKVTRQRKSFLTGNVHEKACPWLESNNNIAAFFGKDIQMFVLSIDIRRSTELMLKANSEFEFGLFLTDICTELALIVKKNYGVFEKFTGDGILAFFPVFFSGQDAGYFVTKAATECHAAFSKEYRKSHKRFSLVLNDVGLGIGIDFGSARLLEIAGGFAIIGTPVVYACRFSAAPAGQTYANISAHTEIVKQFSGVISFIETDILIKHEGLAKAYATTLNSIDFTPHLPEWDCPAQAVEGESSHTTEHVPEPQELDRPKRACTSSRCPMAVDVQAI